MTKPNAIRMPGKERPAASRLVIQRPLTTKPHQKNLCRNKKPSAGQPIRQTAEGLDFALLSCTEKSANARLCIALETVGVGT
jgi:hypothetical protein